MRQGTREMSRMTTAAFVAAAGAGQMSAPLEHHADAGERAIAAAPTSEVELADPDLPTNRAAKLARRWTRAAIMVEEPQAPIMFSQRNPATRYSHNYGRRGDHRPRLRRGRFW